MPVQLLVWGELSVAAAIGRSSSSGGGRRRLRPNSPARRRLLICGERRALLATLSESVGATDPVEAMIIPLVEDLASLTGVSEAVHCWTVHCPVTTAPRKSAND